MGSDSELQALARTVAGPPRAALRRLLVLVCEQLGMDLAFVSALTPDDQRVLRVVVSADGHHLTEMEGLSQLLEETWCGEVLARDGLMVADAADEPALQALPITSAAGIACHAGVPLRSGERVVGTLCAISRRPHPDLNDRDRAVLLSLAPVLTDWLLALDEPSVPRQRTGSQLADVAEAVSSARSVEELSRPLLDALHDLTGLASTYLTVIHERDDEQEIRYSLNTRDGFALPEGLRVPWADTLCKRALDEGRPCTVDVPGTWGDSQVAADLGIEVYVSVPVSLADGRVWGTLCAADSQQADVEEHLPTMRLFSRLIAAEVERTEAVERASERARAAELLADTDALTGLTSRRVVEPWLDQQLPALDPGDVVVAAFVDVDDFKAVNDELGHAAGDRVLVEVAHRLRAASRPGDLVARLGGDEFLVAARMPRQVADTWSVRLRSTSVFETEERVVRTSVGIAQRGDGDASALLEAADRAMYAAKRG